MKRVSLKPGKYILAVSGGVDSMVLLNMLARQRNPSGAVGNRIAETRVSTAGLSKIPGVEVVVAHFDHGIRPDSSEDEKFVRSIAEDLGLTYESGSAKLGTGASEETARNARYDFLRSMKQKYSATAIVTAHHQDDLIETAILNILRGTGPQGLVAMLKNQEIIRPLLAVSKKEIIDFAKKNKIAWREDSTNQNTDYLRNYVRLNVLPKISVKQQKTILDNIRKISGSSQLKGELIESVASSVIINGKVDRQRINLLPVSVGNEIIAHTLRNFGWRDFTKKDINKINVILKVGTAGSEHSLNKKLKLKLTSKQAIFVEE